MEWWHASVIIGPIIGIFGYLLLFLSLHSIFSELRLKYYGQRATATILSMGSKVANAKTQKGQTCRVYCKFTANDIEYTHDYHIAPKDYIHVRVGQHLGVFYDPINPANTELSKNPSEGCLFWCQVIFISMILGIGISIVIFIVLPFVILGIVNDNGTNAILLAYGIGLCVSIPICSFRCYKGGYCCS